MTRTKPTKRPAPGKPGAGVPLTIDLPGGGQAFFLAKHELTPRRTRPLEVRMTAAAPLIARLNTAAQVGAADGSVDVRAALTGPDFAMTVEQGEQMSELNDVAIMAYLKGWTLDLDLPTCPDDLLDIPEAVYDALRDHAAKLFRIYKLDDFSIDTLGDDLDEADEDLPTSA